MNTRDHYKWTVEEDIKLAQMVIDNCRDNGQVVRGFYINASKVLNRGATSIRKRTASLLSTGLLPHMPDRAKYKPLILLDTEAAWLAGILDGEGSVPSLERKRGDYKGNPARLGNSLRVSLVFNTDLGVIQKVGSLVPFAYVSKPYKRGWARKWMYYVDVYGQRNVYVVLKRLLPYMAESKKIARAKDILEKVLEQTQRHNPWLMKHLET